MNVQLSFDEMARLFPAAAALSELKGSPFDRMTELLKERRRALMLLLQVLTGEDAQRKRPAATAAALARSLSNGGLLFIQTVCAAGAEKTCAVLYRYRPEDPEALFFLLKRQQKEDFSVHYIADALRLLALSKLERNSKLPTLKECLKEKPPQDTRTGMEILQDIIDTLKGRKKANDHRKST